MNAKELEQAQISLNKKVTDMAASAGFSNDDVKPITDGIYDAAKYLTAGRRVMWVMKEPYDVVINGKPKGGGWNLAKSCFAKDNAWANPSWQPIIYSMYGLKHGLYMKQMKKIRNDKSMANILQEIAYINISKMPNRSSSDNKYIGERYQIWKPLLFEQIDAYDPEVIIFAKTFKYFQNDLRPDLNKIGAVSSNGVRVGNAYQWNGRLLLDVYHPNNRKLSREVYVDSIIEAINNNIECVTRN